MKALIFLLTMTFATVANSSEVEVLGKVVSDTHCAYASTATGSFLLSYTNQNLKWGSKVFLKYAFTETMHQRNWDNEQVIELMPVGPFKWQADYATHVASRGSFYYSQMKFLFIVKNEDGTIEFDKGNDSSWGYYQVDLPMQSCSDVSLEVLDIDSIRND